MPLNSQTYIVDQRPTYPLFISAKRYWDPQSPYLNCPSAHTLIFAHATGYNKELWEPIIDDLFDAGDEGVKIREMWSIDAPNHGDAFIANEHILEKYHSTSMWEEYGRTVHAFLTGNGVGIDFSKRRVVGIGNCMGAVAFLLSLDHLPSVHYESLILCEIATMHSKSLLSTSRTLSDEVSKRRDIWSSCEEAYNELKNQAPWNAWDDKVLKSYVHGGLRPLPTLHYPDQKQGVTLKCTLAQEIGCYADLDGLRRIYGSLGAISKRLPCHMMYGAVQDYPRNRTEDDDPVRVFGGLDNVASFSRIPGAGHHIAQANPSGVAQKIYEILEDAPAYYSEI